MKGIMPDHNEWRKKRYELFNWNGQHIPLIKINFINNIINYKTSLSRGTFLFV